ncbi:MAG: hypothetical protein GXO64_04200 [Candidatus Micrarchaeota archaeon]|nr:hypothetical protein [Candidatus Micrarchaeota archaeon]
MKSKKTNAEEIVKLLLIVPVVLSLMLSGCTDMLGGGSGSSGNGVEIKVFRADMPTVNCNQQVNVELRLQNTGDYDAQVATQIFVIDPANWNNPLQNPPNPFTLRAVTDKSVEPPIQTVKWQLRPSCEMLDIPKSSSMDFHPQVRVYHTYKTDAKRSITFVDEEELRVLLSEGKSLAVGEQTTSNGPLSISIETVPFAQTFNSYLDVQIPVHIKITNTGGGKVPGDINNNYPVAITVTAPVGTSFVSCTPQLNALTYGYSNIPLMNIPTPTFTGGGFGDTRSGYVSLFTDPGGQSADMTCFLRVNDPTKIIRQTRYINVKISYIYYKDTQPLTITVKNPAGQSMF